MSKRKNTLGPFVKWAGGKGQLIERFRPLYPDELIKGDIKTYIEPFVGGGAVLFDILQNYNIEEAIIFDLNKELINCYQCIKSNVDELIVRLDEKQQAFCALPFDKRGDYFLSTRREYNQIALNGKYDFEKAADFIFLNKTCYNGLYRVNSKGEFNVPFGHYKNPAICNKDNLRQVSKILQRVTIFHGDYSLCQRYATDNSFVYFDPPYRPIASTQSFVGYAQAGFNDSNQTALADLVKTLSQKGVKMMLSNSDPKNTDPSDNFFDNLYSDFDIIRIDAKRMINCHGDKRGSITEIVVRNYKKEEIYD